MSAERLFQDYNIPHVTEGHKHVTSGWVNIHCPFCVGSQNYHMGVREELTACHCWRCGSHPVVETLSRVLNLLPREVRTILKKYKTGEVISIRKLVPKSRVSIHPLKFPKPHSILNKYGKQYLAKRGFDPEYLEHKWGLCQTGPVSFLDKISYGNRILIPIYWNGEMVSFQSRDITDKSDRKYLACPMKREKIHHKNILYGYQEFWEDSHGIIIVEGVTDVWRLGDSAVATFGIEFKMEQVLQLKKLGRKRFFIVFDNEPQAQAQARVLATKLRTLGREAYIERVEGDPGSMKQRDADYFVKELLR
ncbi:MAG: hypothetical protein M0R31_05745 [Candidatus Riflebacteria bacterium]|nr:hypothetical protein [Candidatus Riflebacteria bacterium]